MPRQCCAVFAGRENGNKRFSICDGGAHCPDFSRDISIEDIDEDADKPTDMSPEKQDTCANEVIFFARNAQKITSTLLRNPR